MKKIILGAFILVTLALAHGSDEPNYRYGVVTDVHCGRYTITSGSETYYEYYLNDVFVGDTIKFEVENGLITTYVVNS